MTTHSGPGRRSPSPTPDPPLPCLSSPKLVLNNDQDGEVDAGDDARRPFQAWAAATSTRTTIGSGSGSGSSTSLNHGFASPLRQHRRTPSAHRQVKVGLTCFNGFERDFLHADASKETLNAHVEFTNDDPDGRTHHRINQYVIKEEIGRGSYGAVHRATDQFGNEFAIKEFSKTRLRRRAQSQAMRQGPVGPRRAPGRGGPLAPQLSGLQLGEQRDSLFFIREEVAIMKKLNHPNLAQLIEVLDDPDEDSLYMVMEMCPGGVVMRVGLDEQAAPHDAERCRFWFRDLILGIEYLHAQGVIHRDIKPDNLLLAADDALKVVDFGVSEMFEKEKQDRMRTAKSAGSPAFLPPELCGRHTEVSGTAADIWSMGVTLYCLRYGTIPFRGAGILEIYEAIKERDVRLPEGEDPAFADLVARLLDKNPDTRITMPELRQHPWVTKDDTDNLLSAEENCAHLIEPPNELELSHAFTKKMDHILCVMKAITKLKSLLARRQARNRQSAANLLAPSPLAPEITTTTTIATITAAAADVEDKEIEEIEKARNREIAARFADQKRLMTTTAGKKTALTLAQDAHRQTPDADATSSTPEPRFLGIGTGVGDGVGDGPAAEVVSDSPTAVDFNVYDRAYEEAITRTRARRPSRAGRPVVYMNKMVREKEHFRDMDDLVDGGASVPPTPPPARPRKDT